MEMAINEFTGWNEPYLLSKPSSCNLLLHFPALPEEIRVVYSLLSKLTSKFNSPRFMVSLGSTPSEMYLLGTRILHFL